MANRTFWLYFGTRVLTGVRMPEGSSYDAVRRHAIENEQSVPIGHRAGETPFDFRAKLARARVTQ